MFNLQIFLVYNTIFFNIIFHLLLNFTKIIEFWHSNLWIFELLCYVMFYVYFSNFSWLQRIRVRIFIQCFNYFFNWSGAIKSFLSLFCILKILIFKKYLWTCKKTFIWIIVRNHYYCQIVCKKWNICVYKSIGTNSW